MTDHPQTEERPKQGVMFTCWELHNADGTVTVFPTEEDARSYRSLAEGETITEREPVELLNPGTPIRSKSHPELTGRIKCWEYRDRETLSMIPYNVAWDDESRAHDLLGWLWIYASPESIEPLPASPAPKEESS